MSIHSMNQRWQASGGFWVPQKRLLLGTATAQSSRVGLDCWFSVRWRNLLLFKHRFRWCFNGHATGTDWLEVPAIYKVYFLGLCKGISPQNMAWKMVRLRTSICWILKISHWMLKPSKLGKDNNCWSHSCDLQISMSEKGVYTPKK